MLQWARPKATPMIANTFLIAIAQATVVKPGNVANVGMLVSRPNNLKNHLVIVRQTDRLEYSGIIMTKTLGVALEIRYLNSQIPIRPFICSSTN